MADEAVRIQAGARWLAAGLVAVSAVGCDRSEPTQFRVYGAVSFDGKPVTTGTVMFQPQAGKAVVGRIQDGSYELFAPAGSHRVGVVSLAEIPENVDPWQADTHLPPPPVPPRYHRPETSGIVVDVAPQDVNTIDLALPQRRT